jgi:hypothetical protein
MTKDNYFFPADAEMIKRVRINKKTPAEKTLCFPVLAVVKFSLSIALHDLYFFFSEIT